jgi:hypothetical protein
VILLAVLASSACRRSSSGSGGGTGSAENQLIAQGRYDEVIAQLGERTDAESLYLLGLAWAGKARSAPLPTPGPGEEGPGWKPEERRAFDLLQRSLAARPDHAGAHQAVAELVAPHALERLDLARSGSARPAVPGGQPDAGVDTVLTHLTAAVQADTVGTSALEMLVQFAVRAGRLPEADGAYQELLRRRREDPDLLVRYGDFLAGTRQDARSALPQYAQALMWRPDDAATRRKVAEIHLQAAGELLRKHEYASAEARLADARRAGADPASPQAARLRELEQVLRDIRGR